MRILQYLLVAISLASAVTFAWGWLIPVFEAQRTVAAFQQTHYQALRSDTSDWAPERINEVRRASSPPLAVLRIDAVNLVAPVYEGTDDETLKSGVGWIKGTTHIDDSGNIGLSGHRDSYFRKLKDVQIGQELEVITRTGARSFRVEQLMIVNPGDTFVLQGRDKLLTLITCYPFQFVGAAPKRYIVQARETTGESADA